MRISDFQLMCDSYDGKLGVNKLPKNNRPIKSHV